jgi:hypothetical protein
LGGMATGTIFVDTPIQPARLPRPPPPLFRPSLLGVMLLRKESASKIRYLGSTITNETRGILDPGLAKYTVVLDMIRRSQSLVQGLKIEACNYCAAFLHAFVHPIMLS